MSGGLVLAAVLVVVGSLACLWLTETHERNWWPWPVQPEPEPETEYERQLRLMAEQLQTMAATLGEALMPAVRAMTEAVNEFGRTWERAFPPDG